MSKTNYTATPSDAVLAVQQKRLQAAPQYTKHSSVSSELHESLI